MARSPNDDRSDRFNPTSGAYWAAEENEARQRGDDDDDDEFWGYPADLRLNPRELGLIPSDQHSQQNPGRGTPTPARNAPRVLDRLSHFVQAVGDLIEVACAEAYEMEMDQETRREVERERERIRKLEIERRDEGEAEGWGYEQGSRLYPGTALLSWREALQYVTAEVLRCLKNVNGKPASLEFTWQRTVSGHPHRWELIPRRTATPGEFDTRTFESIEDALIQLNRLVVESEEAEKEVEEVPFVPAGRTHRDPEIKTITRRLGFAIPPNKNDRSRWSATLGAIQWLVAPCAEWWPIDGVLGALHEAALQAEWSGTSILVFGVRVAPGKGKAFWDSRGASLSSEAAGLARSFTQRGFRTIVVDTPEVEGPVTWAQWHGGDTDTDDYGDTITIRLP